METQLVGVIGQKEGFDTLYSVSISIIVGTSVQLKYPRSCRVRLGQLGQSLGELQNQKVHVLLTCLSMSGTCVIYLCLPLTFFSGSKFAPYSLSHSFHFQ